MIDLMVLDDGTIYVVYDEDGCQPPFREDGTPNRIAEVIVDAAGSRVAILPVVGSTREFGLPPSVLSEVLSTRRAMATPVGGPLACLSYPVGMTIMNV